jgi:hypothetical protein
MIAELTQDLINKLNTVPDFGGRVGAQVGGTDTDSTMAEAPIPFAWVIFANSNPQSTDQNNGRKYLVTENNFIVIIVFEYAGVMTDTTFIEEKLVLIDKCVEAVHASNEIPNAGLWQYNGVDLYKVYSNRLVYQLNFTAVGHQQII